MHRNISATSIIINQQGKFKITDFRLSRKLVLEANRKFYYSAQGLPIYMAP